MRTSKLPLLGLAGSLLIALAVGPLILVHPVRAAGEILSNQRSPDVAYRAGILAYQEGSWQVAMDALTYASRNGIMLADFHLARMYADSQTPYYNRTRAYELYKSLSHALINIDPDLDPRVLFAGQSITAFARYLKNGIHEINLPPDPRRAIDYLSHAAGFFGDADAEFELARMRLTGDGIEAAPSLAMHSLSRLARQGHAGSIATLADLYWSGSEAYWQGKPIVEKDPVAAYGFISLAAKLATYSDRLWIEDAYQRIYCGVTASTRQRGVARVAGWRQQTSPRLAERRSNDPMRQLALSPTRTCADGSIVVFGPDSRPALATPKAPATPQTFQGDATGMPIDHRSGP